MAGKLILDFFTNPLFLAAASGWLLAQLCKLVIQLVRHAPIDRLLTGGGMPSSHTATTMALALETALVHGTHGFEFPMAFFFMIMVVYDALNVRYITGEQNKVLNHFIKERADKGDEYSRKLPHYKELLGHTLPEVIVGALIGIAAALIVFQLPL